MNDFKLYSTSEVEELFQNNFSEQELKQWAKEHNIFCYSGSYSWKMTDIVKFKNENCPSKLQLNFEILQNRIQNKTDNLSVPVYNDEINARNKIENKRRMYEYKENLKINSVLNTNNQLIPSQYETKLSVKNFFSIIIFVILLSLVCIMIALFINLTV